jgi:hypothetical protein
MRKAIFDLKVWTEDGAKNKPVSGWVNDQFGIHKDDKWYVITHLRSGMAMPGRFLFLKHARALAERFDRAVFPAEMDGPELQKNIPKLREIFSAVEKDLGHVEFETGWQVYRG